MAAQVKFLDTTLRDGEQSAGIGMTVDEKMQIARQLARLKVDIIEAGFAASSPGDFQAVQRIAEDVQGPIICSLSRAVPGDVDAAWGAIKSSEKPRIHVFLSSSEIHQMHQLRKDREDVMTMAVDMVSRARGYCEDVEFSPMDATRTNPDYLYRMLEEVIKAGASTINIADTVGYAIPSDFQTMLRDIQQNVPGIENVTLSVHCHNDLGLAVSNSLAAIEVGARQVEGCINGIGERAGNASLEEIIMALDTRKDLFGVELNVDTTQIYPSSRLVSRITGMNVQANKAIVGENAFRHASGIHQDGVLKDRSTYEVMQPERVGLPPDVQLVLGKLSGRAGLQARLEALGYSLSREGSHRRVRAVRGAGRQEERSYRPRPGNPHGRGEPDGLGAHQLLHRDGALHQRGQGHPHGDGAAHRAGRQRQDRRLHGQRPGGRGLPRHRPGDWHHCQDLRLPGAGRVGRPGFGGFTVSIRIENNGRVFSGPRREYGHHRRQRASVPERDEPDAGRGRGGGAAGGGDDAGLNGVGGYPALKGDAPRQKAGSVSLLINYSRIVLYLPGNLPQIGWLSGKDQRFLRRFCREGIRHNSREPTDF